MKQFLLAVGVVIAAALTINVTRIALAPSNSAAGVVERTLQADNVIFNYEYFHDVYNDIQANDKNIKEAQTELSTFLKTSGPRKEWDLANGQAQEESRLRMISMGLKQKRAEMVAAYNSNASKINRNLFRDKSLPSRIEN